MEDPILEFNILDAVYENDGNLTQRHISQKLGRSVASVNFSLRLLAVKGYITISGANPRNLRYHLTPRGLLQKSTLAYNFLRRQQALYEDVRKGLLEKLRSLVAENVREVAVYGWTPVTESAILYLISERIKVRALYVESIAGLCPCSRLPLKPIEEFLDDCEVLVLMEPLPKEYFEISIRKIACFPVT
jgi:hypothetical protein